MDWSLPRGAHGWSSCSLLFLGLTGCIFGDYWGTTQIEGQLFDESGLIDLQAVRVGARLYTNGSVTEEIPATKSLDENGRFAIGYHSSFRGMTAFLFISIDVYERETPFPDEVEIIVVEQLGCQQSYRIPVAESMLVETNANPNVLELPDPILLTPCE